MLVTVPDKLTRLRREINAINFEFVDIVIRRAKIARTIAQYKQTRGLAFVDLEREISRIEEALAANPGPLSRETLSGLVFSMSRGRLETRG